MSGGNGPASGGLSRRQLLAGLAAACGARPARADGLEWWYIPDLPRAVSGHFAGVDGKMLITAGGAYFTRPPYEGGQKLWTDEIAVLDLEAVERKGTGWRTVGRLPAPLAYGATVSTRQGVVCIGGGDAERHSAAVFRLTWREGRIWRSDLPPLPGACAFHAAAQLRDTLYVVGGQETPTSTEALHQFWSLDLSRNGAEWKTLLPWPGPPRILPVAAAQGGIFYLFGGCELSRGADGKAVRRYLADGYGFQPGKGWRKTAPAPWPVAAAPAALRAGSHILVFGGDDGANAARIMELRDRHPGFRKEIVAYDVDTDSWLSVGELPLSLVTTNAVRWGDNWLLPGGEDRPGHRSPRVLKGRWKKD